MTHARRNPEAKTNLAFRVGASVLVLTGVVHLLVLGADALTYVDHWLAGGLWTLDHWLPVADQNHALVLSGFAFWSSIASAAVPTIILGMHWLWLDRRALPVPRIAPIALAIWGLILWLLMPPSGFVLVVLSAGAVALGRPRGGWA